MSVETKPDRVARGPREFVRPISGSPGDYDELLSRIGSASVVLVGEGSHGTHEFDRERAQ